MLTVSGEACCNTVTNDIPKRMRNIQIRTLNYGYVVDVDCHSFAIETKDKLIKSLLDYINNPQETEKKWFDTKQI